MLRGCRSLNRCLWSRDQPKRNLRYFLQNSQSPVLAHRERKNEQRLDCHQNARLGPLYPPRVNPDHHDKEFERQQQMDGLQNIVNLLVRAAVKVINVKNETQL